MQGGSHYQLRTGVRNTGGMPRPPAQTDPITDHLAELLLAARAIDAAHAADRADYTASIRAAARNLGPGQRRATARALTEIGISVSEMLLRRWASQPTPTDTPTWWEVIDHRDPPQVVADLQRALGMAVDADLAPAYQVPVTSTQVGALRAALPDAVIGPLTEVAG
jgi:hypothetical protein